MKQILIALLFTLSTPAIASSSPKKLLRAMNLIKTAKDLNSVNMASSKRTELLRAQLLLNSLELEKLSEHQRSLVNSSLFEIEQLHDSEDRTIGSCGYFETIKEKQLEAAFKKKKQGDVISYYQGLQFLISMAENKSDCPAQQSWIRELSLLKIQS